MNQINHCRPDDHRRKLSEEQREEMRRIYSNSTITQKELAKRFGVSCQTVNMIVSPKSIERNRKYQRKRYREKIVRQVIGNLQNKQE